jgi:hypothetical protein
MSPESPAELNSSAIPCTPPLLMARGIQRQRFAYGVLFKATSDPTRSSTSAKKPVGFKRVAPTA